MQEASALGLKPDDFIGRPVVVWPENRQAVQVFLAMRTQWRIGMNGPTGLDYSVLPEIWRRTKVPPQDRDRVFEEIQLIEGGALAEIHKD